MRVERFLLAGAAMLLALGGATTGARAETPKDTVVMAKAFDDMISLDPAETFEFSGGEVNGNTYDRLLYYDLKNVANLYGTLAESWSVDADGKTYTFKLRPGVKFSSGNPVTSADVVYSITRAVTLNKSPGFILTQFGINKDTVGERVHAPDAMTVVLQTEKAVAPSFFYYCLTAGVGSIVDGATVKSHEENGDFGNGWLKQHSAGSGPYVLRSWKANESYILDANPNYRGDQPKTPHVFVRYVKETATQRLLLEKGDVDFARNLGKDELDAVSKNPDIELQQGVKGAITYLGLNQKNQYLQKPEVVEALKYLVDYDGIERNVLHGTRVVHQAFLPLGFLGAIDDKPYHYDVAKAKALLAKAGLANGFSITMDVWNNYPWADIAQALQASWAQVGIKVELIPGDGKQVITKYRARNHDIIILDWGPDYQDPNTNAQTFASNPDNSDQSPTKTLAWRNSWEIPELTKRTQDAVLEPDPKKRAEIYEQLQREVQKIAPFVIMYQQIEVAAHRKDVTGFVMGPGFADNLYAGIEKH
ncbi:MAG TPA: ABC transporter substrate-binding protein [Stellaceae bacterium]|nr:ABC transporter substrate-binding protein [Stellaceae bacterium]